MINMRYSQRGKEELPLWLQYDWIVLGKDIYSSFLDLASSSTQFPCRITLVIFGLKPGRFQPGPTQHQRGFGSDVLSTSKKKNTRQR